MKRPFILLAGFLASAPLAMAQSVVYSANIVGLQKVTAPAGEMIQASNPFVKNSITITDVVGNQMTGGVDFGLADNILTWTGSEYNFYFLADTGGELEEIDGKWISLDGVGNPVIATETLPTGKGFWIKSNAAAAQTVTFVGDVENAPTKTIPLNEGLNLVSYPYSTTVDINSPAMGLNLAAGCVGGESPAESDTLWLWVDGAYQTLFLVDYPSEESLHDKWCFLDAQSNVVPAEIVLQPGQGFWYNRKDNQPALTWTTQKPY